MLAITVGAQQASQAQEPIGIPVEVAQLDKTPVSTNTPSRVQDIYFLAEPLIAKLPIIFDLTEDFARSTRPDAAGQARVTLEFPQVAWNEMARDLVAESKTTPPIASRIYALLSIAQFDALAQARGIGYFSSPDPATSEKVAMSTAAAELLNYFFPQAASRLSIMEKNAQEPESAAGRIGIQIGRQVAAQIIAFHDGHGVPAADGYTTPSQGGWYSAETAKPLLPTWGEMSPFVMQRPDQFRPLPPPLPGTPEFQAALNEVRAISDNRTADQSANARYWADGPGTATPPGHWNQIAVELIQKHQVSDASAVFILQVMNSAIADAGVACWDAKYAFNLIRPSQADPAITTPVGLPNFPSYPSGHATFSGAAAVVLGYFFPGEAQALWKQAEQAAQSRVDGGIHYSFDGSTGLALGKKIGELAIRLRVVAADAARSQSPLK